MRDERGRGSLHLVTDGEGGSFDVQGVVRSLPRTHILVLRAALAGFDEAELATLTGVPRESVRPLLRVAVAKLGTSLAAPLDGSGAAEYPDDGDGGEGDVDGEIRPP
jgi:hypothetical protein